MAKPLPRSKSGVDLAVFGYSAPSTTTTAKQNMTDFALLFGQLAGLDIAVTALPSYERVTQMIHKKEIDLAWLSPIPFIALHRSRSVVPLASPHRHGKGTYHGAIIVHAKSKIASIEDLRKKRAAWVDRHSSTGFVMPRIELLVQGLDPREAFGGQHFYGTHEAVATAVADKRADFGATWVSLDGRNKVLRGPWSANPKIAAEIRVLATFGEIPADVLAMRSDLDANTRGRLERAVLEIGKTAQGKKLIDAVFGADDFKKTQLASYEELREQAAEAAAEGLLEPEEEIEEVQTVFQAVDRTQPVAIGGLDRAVADLEGPKSSSRSFPKAPRSSKKLT
jgi:phosphonate transport system substrate-binding protein